MEKDQQYIIDNRDQFLLALEVGCGRDSSPEMVAALRFIWEEGLFIYHADRWGGYWTVADGTILPSDMELEQELDMLMLELLIEGKLALSTNRSAGGPGIYWGPLPEISNVQ